MGELGLAGLNNTSPICWQFAQVTLKYSASTFCRFFCRQSLQRAGLLVKPFFEKNSCSPAVQIKSLPQSLHLRVLSSKSAILRSQGVKRTCNRVHGAII